MRKTHLVRRLPLDFNPQSQRVINKFKMIYSYFAETSRIVDAEISLSMCLLKLPKVPMSFRREGLRLYEKGVYR